MNIPLSQLGAELQRQVQRVIVKDFTEPLQTVNTYLAGRAAECFDRRQAPDGTPWAGKATGVKSGALRAELTDPTRGVITNGVHLERGSSLIEASIMQYGVPKTGKGGATKTGRRRKRKPLKASQYRTPPRPVLGLTEADADKIGLTVAEWIVNRAVQGAT